MTGDALVAILRLAFVLLLYAFLFSLVAALRRDLRGAAQPAVAPRAAAPRETAADGRLIVIDGGEAGLASGSALPLAGDALIGRAPSSEIRIEDRLISARHARLFRRAGRWFLADLDSTNGTLLNDHPVDGEQPIEYGDVIAIGTVRLKLAR